MCAHVTSHVLTFCENAYFHKLQTLAPEILERPQNLTKC